MLAAVIVGALCGESIGFALGRFFGPKIRDSRLGRRIGIKNWHRAEYYVDRRGGIAVFVSRFLPVLHSLVPVTVGMSTMRYRRFIAWTAPACAIWAVAYVTVGWVVAGSFRALQDQLHFAGYLFVAAIVVFGGAVLAGQEADRAPRGAALGSPRRRRREHDRGLTHRGRVARSGADAAATRRLDRRGVLLQEPVVRQPARWRCRPTTSARRRSRRSARRDPPGSGLR